ncbi:MAG: radical SAM protein [Candidatus ainarchaeum sp.]|nr:radical SAM protein [Candidatus ainarchaeum sp.]
MAKKTKKEKTSAEDKYRDVVKKYNYLGFLYNATHPGAYCASPPHQVYIELTNVCNLRCTHCPQSTMRRKPQYMDMKLFEKIIKELAPHKPFIDLYLQGESLLHPKIVDAVKICRKYGLLPRITTNATLLKKNLSKKLIDAGLDKIEFSMSGATKKGYEAIHRGAKYEDTLNNMLDFLELNAGAGFPVHARPVFVQEEKTINEKEKYIRLFSKLPLDDIHVSPLINMFGWNKELDLSPFKNKPREEWPICKCPWRQIGINADGSVRACIFDYDSRYLVGDENKESIVNLWNSEKMQKFRQTIIDRRYEEFDKPGLPLCTECSQIWPSNANPDTTQLPQDFCKEMDNFFKNEQHLFRARYAPLEEKKKKAEWLKKNRKEWLKEALAD